MVMEAKMVSEHEFELEICRVSKEVAKIKVHGKNEEKAIKRAIEAARNGNGLFYPSGDKDIYCRTCRFAPTPFSFDILPS